jgi:hypothetical protein
VNQRFSRSRLVGHARLDHEDIRTGFGSYFATAGGAFANDHEHRLVAGYLLCDLDDFDFLIASSAMALPSKQHHAINAGLELQRVSALHLCLLGIALNHEFPCISGNTCAMLVSLNCCDISAFLLFNFDRVGT